MLYGLFFDQSERLEFRYFTYNTDKQIMMTNIVYTLLPARKTNIYNYKLLDTRQRAFSSTLSNKINNPCSIYQNFFVC